MGSRLEKKSNEVRKLIENHEFKSEDGEEYEPSKFGGFPEYFRRKKIKLQNRDVELRAQSSNNPPIFKGVVAHVNGYTQPSLNDLHELIVSHSGGFIQYLDGKTQVTHIIASSLTPKKVEEFRRYRIVKPAWIVDSVQAGKLLPWNSYRVVDEGAGQKVLQFENGIVTSQVNQYQRGYRDQTDSSWYTQQLTDAENSSNTQLPTPDISSPVLETKDPLHTDGKVESSGNADYVAPKLNSCEGHTENSPDPLPSNFQNDALAITSNDEQQAGAPEEADHQEEFQLKHENYLLEEHDDATLKRKTDSPSDPPAVKRSKMTAAEHNSILLSDPRIRKSSVLDPDFLEQYYRESRLHHLSTWKADLKAQLQAMTAEQSASQKKARKHPPGCRRYVLHVDFDSFFVAVSLKNRPEYTDQPACVAHGAGNASEIASCNYPAREYGVKNGMWMKRAHELCKNLKVLPYDFPGYEAASKLFYEAVMSSGGIVQSISIDEALIDVTTYCLQAGGSDGTGINEGSIWREQAKADEIAQQLRDEVKQKTGCAVSVGIGGNILLAKTALRKAKPAGQHQVKPEDALDFIGGLQVQDLPGVAYHIGGKLEELGIKYVKDIRECSKERLLNALGPKTSEKIWNYARAIDSTEVGDQVVRKSVSAEVNWGVRFETQEQAEEFVESLCGELNKRLLKEKVKGKQLTMKILRRAADAPLDPPKHLGHGKCDTFNKSVALGVATNEKEVIAKEALSILRFHGIPAGELRGLGVQMTKLEPIKGDASGNAQGSQKRLQFLALTKGERQSIEPLQSTGSATQDESPGPSRKHLQFKRAPLPVDMKDPDPPQDEIETPKKPKNGRTLEAALANSPSKKPLNTMGTQFLLPTQVDPSVLAELPDDIRSKLHKATSEEVNENSKSKGADTDVNSKPKIPSTILPNQSQLDPQILEELPEDVRAEILEHYASTSLLRSGQALLPQSPRKNRTLPMARKTTSTRGRPRGSTSFLSRLKGGATRSNRTSTLTQANFIARSSTSDQVAESENGQNAQLNVEIADDFLEALPENIRREVIAQQRAEQRKRNAGIELSNARSRHGRSLGKDDSDQGKLEDSGYSFIVSSDSGAVGDVRQKERVLVLPPKPDRPGFTTKKLTKVEELRDAINLWYTEFKDDGPYKEDVDALGRYLSSVVCEEGDMGKAVSVVKWMEWVIGDAAFADDASKSDRKWSKAVESAKSSVKEAVNSRGLGAVDL